MIGVRNGVSGILLEVLLQGDPEIESDAEEVSEALELLLLCGDEKEVLAEDLELELEFEHELLSEVSRRSSKAPSNVERSCGLESWIRFKMEPLTTLKSPASEVERPLLNQE